MINKWRESWELSQYSQMKEPRTKYSIDIINLPTLQISVANKIIYEIIIVEYSWY